jgi:hypothetical protein
MGRSMFFPTAFLFCLSVNALKKYFMPFILRTAAQEVQTVVIALPTAE